MSAADFLDPSPVFRVNPPPPRDPTPATKPVFDPTADPVWGTAFSQMPDEPRGYRVRSEDIWQRAREAYQEGCSAETVCTAFDLGLSAFRQRARREGWRRSDAPEVIPDPIGFPPEPEDAMSTEDLADLSWRSAAQAIRRGRVYEARAWMRLTEELKSQARHEARQKAAADAALARDGAAEDDGEDEAQLHPLHPLHGEEGVQSSTDSDPFSEADIDGLVQLIEANGEDDGDLAKASRRVKQVRAMAAAIDKLAPP